MNFSTEVVKNLEVIRSCKKFLIERVEFLIIDSNDNDFWKLKYCDCC